MLLMVSIAVAAALAQTPSQAAAQALPGIGRTDLVKSDLSIPGREAIQVRVTIPAGVTAPRHKHPGEEIAYVLKGTLEYRLDGKPPVRVNAGEALFIPSGAVHSAANVGSGEAIELATYVVEKGKPLVVPVP